MLEPYSSTEKVRRETLFSTATGTAFLRISEFLGFTRPLVFEEEAWRKAMQLSFYNARGTPGVVFAFLEAAFSPWIRESTYTGTATSSNEITISSGSCQLDGRFARVGGDLLFVSHYTSNKLVFHDFGNTVFKAANFTISEQYEVQILPFLIREENCIYTLYLDESVLRVPATYVRDHLGDADEYVGGDFSNLLLSNIFLFDILSETLGERQNLHGDLAIYFGVENFQGLFLVVLEELLAAGIIERIIPFKWCEESPPLYNDLSAIQSTGTYNPNASFNVAPTRI